MDIVDTFLYQTMDYPLVIQMTLISVMSGLVFSVVYLFFFGIWLIVASSYKDAFQNVYSFATSLLVIYSLVYYLLEG